jgi:hypothetical protein
LALSIDQLSAFTPNGISGYSAFQLELLVNQWNNTFVELYSNDDWSYYPSDSMLLFKEDIFVVVSPMYRFPSRNGVVNVTWIEMTLTLVDPTPVLDEGTIQNLYEQTIAGIRKDQVKLLSELAIAAISVEQAAYLLLDTISAFNGTQIQAITVDAFAAIPINSLASIDPLTIPYITAAQVAKLSPDVIYLMTCDQLTNFTKPQIDAMTFETKIAFESQIRNCNNSSTTTGHTSTTTGHTSTTGTTGTTGHTTTGHTATTGIITTGTHSTTGHTSSTTEHTSTTGIIRHTQLLELIRYTGVHPTSSSATTGDIINSSTGGG